MAKNKYLIEELKQFEEIAGKDEELIEKLNDFLVLLQDSELDSRNIAELKTGINKVFDKRLSEKDLISELKEVATSDLDKMEQLTQLETLLLSNHLDSKQAKRISSRETIMRFVKAIIGLLFVTLGFAMIIMPAPPYFEMFTIFYFNPNDGVTLMDLISLIIIACGVYIMLKSVLNFKIHE